MTDTIDIAFGPLGQSGPGDLVVFIGDDLALSGAARDALGGAGADLVAKAAASEKFKGRSLSAMVLPAPAGLSADRLVVVGLGSESDRGKIDWPALGGFTAAKVAGRTARVVLDLPGVAAGPEQAAAFALGGRLRAYTFDRYKTKKKPDAEDKSRGALTILTGDHAAASREAEAAKTLAEGVILARDLVNEPPNVLYPEEFAKRAQELTKLGVAVEVLEPARLRELGMGALLAVAQGSVREPRVVVMRWNGGPAGEAPVAFIGKGVIFDSGGVSIKPGGGMEDMKGDMGGAAAVVGALHALASRKARCNVVGAIGIVENMPDGGSYRPSDILTSMSGQTIEVINTDAEGRLVLADVITHIVRSEKPKAMIDLATLTGAIIVALGQDIAGMFSNDDALAEKIRAAGEVTGEAVWRMPLIPAYDKAIDSKFADMKNTGGRHGGAATAASFIKRYVEDTPWAHLDIAGVAMSSTANEINKSWGAGWGVRLLDRLIRDNYEAR
ncbi:leucyl aminopeptidase [Methylobacterium aerolatum]|uniref:Probable cytosol aminopeptidase n=1 Tax=Methylobacterium aerolatum TaxID=418708 RepID=A0ABU0HWM0_9HYPH|nr:leucyl aminopeptidase [Methylobacterium aerolatum]MDQ0446730.1 leucyl aminopeptidase [Methylobacterium aerolatum]GJD33697.1 Cytosol aminopeptidase [Methylobacterium aerolatum]